MALVASATICEHVQELANGNINCNNVINTFHGLGETYFELAVTYKTNNEPFVEGYKVQDYTGKILGEFENKLAPTDEFHISITELELDLENPGIHFIEILVNGECKSRIPFQVLS